MISPTKARIHGYLCADGHIMYRKETKTPTTHYEIRFYTDEKALAEIFRVSIKEAYDFTPPLHFSSLRRIGCFEIRICRKEVFQNMMKYGKFGTYGWMPPAEIFDDKNAAKEWIKAFFDGEAYVNVNRGKIRIQVKSANCEGLKHVRNLLAKHFNVNAKLYGPYFQNNGKYVYYQLEIIRKDSLIKYKAKIGFYSPAKKLKLARVPG